LLAFARTGEELLTVLVADTVKLTAYVDAEEPVPLTLKVYASETEGLREVVSGGGGVNSALHDEKVVADGEGEWSPLLEAAEEGVKGTVGDTLGAFNKLEPTLGVCEPVFGMEDVPVPLVDGVGPLVAELEAVMEAETPSVKLLVGVELTLMVELSDKALEIVIVVVIELESV
jgi:hypothetical protein